MNNNALYPQLLSRFEPEFEGGGGFGRSPQGQRDVTVRFLDISSRFFAFLNKGILGEESLNTVTTWRGEEGGGTC